MVSYVTPTLHTSGGITTANVLSVTGVIVTEKLDGERLPESSDCTVTCQVPAIVGAGLVDSEQAVKARTEQPIPTARRVFGITLSLTVVSPPPNELRLSCGA
jgi:hypothetical protein